eukprot:8416974-Alexandrium_andersonii.AAC.1
MMSVCVCAIAVLVWHVCARTLDLSRWGRLLMFALCTCASGHNAACLVPVSSNQLRQSLRTYVV